jgi:hypothetical protein
MGNTYSVVDLRGFADSMRKAAADSFSETYTENLDEFISNEQIINMIHSQSLGLDENNDYIIDEDIFDNIFDDIRDWLYGVGIAKLAASGKIECAWDNNSNEMVFWLPNKSNPQHINHE